ncbi:hypothetical protein [Winogradskyella sp. SM1960]|uniref:hypothetical protein n=1 Tax=Winogradskyella sp. SM1960 TaxID=2865955 RepID=UPI001CD1D9DB|nr:hypothetical protein [Winogradskyella sp. SM1960]
MKQIALSIFLLISLVSFADAGNAYRFNLTLVSNSGDTIYGYLYHYTYNNIEQTYLSDTKFKEFIEKDTVTLYSSISTVLIDGLSLDFTKTEFKKTINLTNYSRIRINDYLDFGATERIFELSNEEYNLLKIKQPNSVSIYNERYAENCSLILLSWNSDSNLEKYKTEISKKIGDLSIDLIKNQDELNNFLKKKREELTNDSILLISHCDAL